MYKRQRQAGAAGIGAASDIAAVVDAHATLLAAILAQQLADAEAGIPLSSRIDPSRGDAAGPAKAAVVAALRQVAVLADLVAEGRA